MKQPRQWAVRGRPGLLIGLLLLMACLCGCPPPKSEGPIPLKVAMDPRIGEPFVYQPTKDTFGGFEVDICRYLAARLQRPLQIVPVAWAQLPETVRKKKADLALNAIEKPPAGQIPPELAVTRHYYTAYQQLAVRKKDKFTYNLSDLKGKKVGVVDGSVAQLLLQELNKLKQAKITIVPFPTPEAAFGALAAAQVQGTLTERAVASWFSWKNGKTRLTGEPITQEIPYVGLVRADDPQLQQAIDGALTKVIKDPAFKKIFDKWHVSIKR
ncbi:MAG TPA: ABC transporter substrate-binding protein [Candidatus Obscuribacterales bacterium]